MEMSSPRVRSLRPLKNIVYFPKPQLYNVIEGERAILRRRSKSAEPLRQQSRRSKSADAIEPRVMNGSARRAIRSKSIDVINQPRMPARRTQRFQSVDCRGRNAVTRQPNQRTDVPVHNVNALEHLAQSQAILTTELIKMKNDLNAQNKKVDLLTRQDVANQEFLEKMVKEAKEKDIQMYALRNELQAALNRLGN